MTNPVDETAPVWERCALIVETLALTMEPHKYPSPAERHLIAVVEAGCRGAFAEAIRKEART